MDIEMPCGDDEQELIEVKGNLDFRKRALKVGARTTGCVCGSYVFNYVEPADPITKLTFGFECRLCGFSTTTGRTTYDFSKLRHHLRGDPSAPPGEETCLRECRPKSGMGKRVLNLLKPNIASPRARTPTGKRKAPEPFPTDDENYWEGYPGSLDGLTLKNKIHSTVAMAAARMGTGVHVFTDENLWKCLKVAVDAQTKHVATYGKYYVARVRLDDANSAGRKARADLLKRAEKTFIDGLIVGERRLHDCRSEQA